MARRKAEEPASIEGGWINTFADLMNLLLCFFVLLFSMSTVDADKYEQIVKTILRKSRMRKSISKNCKTS